VQWQFGWLLHLRQWLVFGSFLDAIWKLVAVELGARCSVILVMVTKWLAPSTGGFVQEVLKIQKSQMVIV